MTAFSASPISTMQSPANTLMIKLFGPMQVLVDNKPLPHLRSRKALWLLALLILRHGRPVEREWLAGTLWADVGRSQALANLRSVLSELRNALGTQAYRLNAPNRHSLMLEIADADVDVLYFDTVVAKNEPRALQSAVASYTGALLEGCAEEWVAQERTIREQQYLLALQKLATTAFNEKDLPAAIRYWQQAIRIDALWEVARRGLMESLSESGDTNAAMQVYRDLMYALQRSDPKAFPGVETRALYTRLRNTVRRHDAPRHPNAPPEASAAALSSAGNLPNPITELIGREKLCEEIVERSARARLVTLTGTGGIGKTRLAIALGEEMAAEYPDGVWFVALETIHDPALVIQTVAQRMEIKESAGIPLRKAITDFCRTRHLLLILDNCEHVLEAAAELATHLLHECPHLRILTTSRIALGITGEEVWSIPALAVPTDHTLRSEDWQAVSSYAGVRLFLERARAAQKNFTLSAENASAIALLCTRLEGVPLALELAAARIKVMTVEQMVERLTRHLSNPLDLLASHSRIGAARQKTLRATLDWSYALLEEREQRVLQHLSVFRGGWILEAAEVVCADEKRITSGEVLDLLTALVEKSLVRFVEGSDADSGETGRYYLLEMVRQYADEQLRTAGDIVTVQRKHQQWCQSFATRISQEITGEQQDRALRQADRECDNLRAALEFCADDADAIVNLKIAGMLWSYWFIRGEFRKGAQYLEHALAHEGAQERTKARVRALQGAGTLHDRMGDLDTARKFHQERLEICRELEDLHGAASTLNNIGNVSAMQQDFAIALSCYEESLAIFRQLGDQRSAAWSLSCRGSLAYQRGDYETARSYHEECLAIRRVCGDSYSVAFSLYTLGHDLSKLGQPEKAKKLHTESLMFFKKLGSQEGIAINLTGLAVVALAEKRAVRAVCLIGASQSIQKAIGIVASTGENEVDEEILTGAYARLTPEAYADALQEGSALSAEDAADYALRPDD